MRIPSLLSLILMVSTRILISEATPNREQQTQSKDKEFTNEFAVQLEDDADADRIAEEHGFVNKGQVRRDVENRNETIPNVLTP